jgi:hypothetical protein
MSATINTQDLVIQHDARHALLAHTVDRLAQLKAQIAELREQEAELKEILIASGESAIDSVMYRATISDTKPRDKVDWESIAMKFNPSRQLIRAYTSEGEGYYQVRVYSRKTSK